MVLLLGAGHGRLHPGPGFHLHSCRALPYFIASENATAQVKSFTTVAQMASPRSKLRACSTLTWLVTCSLEALCNRSLALFLKGVKTSGMSLRSSNGRSSLWYMVESHTICSLPRPRRAFFNCTQAAALHGRLKLSDLQSLHASPV